MEDFKTIRRTFGYGRVSTREQDIAGVSPEEQQETITSFVAAYKLPALVPAGAGKPIFFDVESGTEEAEAARKDFQRLLKQVRAGDLVLVAKLDRISRDLIMPLTHVRELKKRGAVVYFISERLDSRDPHAETMIHMWAMGASMEHKRIKERTQGGRRYLRRRGCFVEGKPPFGYLRPAHDREGTHRKLVIDPQAAPIVKEAFEQAAAGASVINLCRMLMAKYADRMAWGRAWILRMLRNRVYTGQIATTPVRPQKGNNSKQLPAEWVDAHEPIVSVELFNEVQVALNKRRGRGRPHETASGTAGHLLRGISKCIHCGAVCASVPASRHARQISGYYACNRKLKPEFSAHGIRKCTDARYHRRDAVDSEIATAFLRRMEALRRSLSNPPRTRERPDFAKSRRELEGQRANVVNAIAAGVITLDAARDKIAELDAGLTEIRHAEKEFEATNAVDTVETRARAKAYVAQVEAEWPSWSVEIQRDFLRAFVTSIRLGGPDPEIQWRDTSDVASRHHAGRMPPIYRDASVPALPPARISAAEALGLDNEQAEAAPARPARRPRRAS